MSGRGDHHVEEGAVHSAAEVRLPDPRRRLEPMEPTELLEKMNARAEHCRGIVERTHKDLLEQLKEHDTTYVMHDIMRNVIERTLGVRLNINNVDGFAFGLEQLSMLLGRLETALRAGGDGAAAA